MKVRHPTLVGVERDVPNPDDWVAHGWVLDAPPVSEPELEPEPAELPKPQSRRKPKYPLI